MKEISWSAKYRPEKFEDIVFPNDKLQKKSEDFYNNDFIQGNILSYGHPGTGKTTLTRILKSKVCLGNTHDLFTLGRKVDSADGLKKWLGYATYGKQRVVLIEEMDKLNDISVTVLKDGLMEDYQHNTTFLATTNNVEKIDEALLTRFNTKINFDILPQDAVLNRLSFILNEEKVIFQEEELKEYVEKHIAKGLRELINDIENAYIDGKFSLKEATYPVKKNPKNAPIRKSPSNTSIQTTPLKRIKPIFIQNTGIDWQRKQPTTQVITLEVKENNLYQTEVVRLEAKYSRVLSMDEMSHELGITSKTLKRRILKGKELPEYREDTSGRHKFPISAVATYLTQGLIKTA